MKFFCIISFLGIGLFSHAIQYEEKIDSLNQVLAAKTPDLEKAKAYVQLSELLYFNNLDTMYYLCNQSRIICETDLETADLSPSERKAFQEVLALAYTNLGYVKNKRLERDSALYYYQTAANLQLTVYDLVGLTATIINASTVFIGKNNYSRAISLLDTCERIVYAGNILKGRGSMHNTQGYIFASQSNLPLAMEKYEKALKFHQLMNSHKGQAVAYNNIASLYSNLGEHKKSIDLYRKSSSLHKINNDLDGMSTVSNNIGHAKLKLKQEDSAMFYYRVSLRYAEEINYKKQIAVSSENIGSRLFNSGHSDSVLFYYFKARAIKIEGQNRRSIGYNSKNLADYHLSNNNLDSALYYAKDALDHALYAKSLSLEKYARKSLVKIYQSKKDYKNAFEQQIKYTELYDSLQRKENQKAIIRNQFKLEYEQKIKTQELANENLNIKNKLIQSENELKEEQLASLKLWIIIFLLIVFSSALFVYGRLKRQKLYMNALEADTRIRINEILQLKNELNQVSSTLLKDVNTVLNTPLTEREAEILGLLCEGLTNKEIANQIFLSVNTIKTHIQSLYVKLDVTNRTQAAIKGSVLNHA
jgi:DNA-binding CsgD family transcriptional regulator